MTTLHNILSFAAVAAFVVVACQAIEVVGKIMGAA
jgi:hypothetical protein